MGPFFYRLDFYGSVLELLGLTILLSYDVPFLQPVLLSMPALRRRRRSLERLRAEQGRFDASRHTQFVPERALRIEGRDAATFLALYPDWRRARKAPQFITLYAVHGNPGLSNEPWIFPSDEQDEPMATALFLSTLLLQEEREIQRIVYSVGFTLMLAGGLLSLLQIIRN